MDMNKKSSSQNMPVAPRLYKIIGPSIVLLGLGLGSGEIILWPHLVSNFGLGIIWAAVIGITFQFFINMEIERYSLIHGESIFVGFSKYFRGSSYWFIFSTFVAWIWPGIIAVSASLLGALLNIEDTKYLAIGLLLIIGLILTLGPSLYKTVERFQKVLIGLGVPIIALITFLVSKSADWQALGKGLIGMGEGYSFIPSELPLFTFLAALAYSGAGGNLNLAQSFYIKEKGYGMCKGTKGISSVLSGISSTHQLEGRTFRMSNENTARFFTWWKIVNQEHFLVFLVTGAFTILLLALLSHATTNGVNMETKDLTFMLAESSGISQAVAPFLGGLFLFLTGLMLFGTQLTVLDSTSRIMAENVVIIEKKTDLNSTYYIILWLQILTGAAILMSGFSSPVGLVVTGAVINALAMFVHIAMTYLLNKKALPRELQISLWRKLIILITWIFFGVLSLWAIVDGITKL